MKVVLDHYEVNRSTMALLPAAHTDYCTLVIEQDRQFFVKEKPIQIVKISCIDGGATYDGRRIAVSLHTNSKRKVPIPINPRENIFAFPTHSPNAFECGWLFYHHVKKIETFTSPSGKNIQSLIIFKNGLQITMDESSYVLEKQMQRTAMCILWFTPRPKDS